MRRVGPRIGPLRWETALAASLAVSLGARLARAGSSADELVREARAHEADHEEDIAARRYTEALTIEATNEAAWMGLAALRFRLGEVAEAARVYGAALARVPTLYRARDGRARCQWVLGQHADAEANMQAYAEAVEDPAAFRELAGWYGVDGRSPAQLAIWRRVLTMATERGDAQLSTEARLMVRALVVVVDSADPASSPGDRGIDPTRRELARIATMNR